MSNLLTSSSLIYRLGGASLRNNLAPFLGASVAYNGGSSRIHQNAWKRPTGVEQSGSILAIKNAKNNPVQIVSRRSMSGDHVTLWTAERVLSGVLVPLLPLALIAPSAPVDYLLAFVLTAHSHWGIEAIVVDYVRPSVFGQVLPKLAVALVYGLSAMTLGGLFYFIYSDVGIGNAIRMLWKL